MTYKKLFIAALFITNYSHIFSAEQERKQLFDTVIALENSIVVWSNFRFNLGGKKINNKMLPDNGATLLRQYPAIEEWVYCSKDEHNTLMLASKPLYDILNTSVLCDGKKAYNFSIIAVHDEMIKKYSCSSIAKFSNKYGDEQLAQLFNHMGAFAALYALGRQYSFTMTERTDVWIHDRTEFLLNNRTDESNWHESRKELENAYQQKIDELHELGSQLVKLYGAALEKKVTNVEITQK